MRAKSKQFICESCGAAYPKWTGKCEQCQGWNTLVEASMPASGKVSTGVTLKTQRVDQIKRESKSERLPTGTNDIDAVLGGGFVPGSVTLIAGEPGIGKSTILLQLAYQIAQKHAVLYISAEESAQQIKMRAERLGTNHKQLQIATSTNTDDIEATISSGKYELVIVDSIQTIASSNVGANPGSVSQVTASAYQLAQAAKSNQTATIIVGHVTKDGHVAGPKLLEHLVDVVLSLEGDRYGGFKLLRSSKNRYGSTQEVGIFDMNDKGLKPVDNPSATLLAERQISDGSIVLATMEGSRPLLVEVQALVNPTNFGYPKRTASGFDLNRLNLLIAMLSRRTKLSLADKDVFVNIVGGIKLNDPGADLAICMAIGSAAKGLSLKEDAVVFGEVGLSGEVRHVLAVDKRIQESKKLGFKHAIGPQAKPKNSFVASVTSVRDALNTYLKGD